MDPPCSECCFPPEFVHNIDYDPGDTPVIYAAYNGHRRCVKAWIDAGADVNASNQYGDTPLEHAARCGHVKCLRLLVEAGADVNIRNEDDETALFEAAYNGYDKCVDALIQAGADVNVISKDGNTALLRASNFSHFKCIYFLVQAGADVNFQDKETNTALLRVLSTGHAFCEYTMIYQELAYVVDNHSHKQSVDLLIRAGADVNIAGNNGDTPLMLAAEKGHDKCIPVLLRAGAQINKLNTSGQNSLQAYVRNAEPIMEDTITLLFAAGERADQLSLTELKGVLNLDSVKYRLKHICREVIRKHLVATNPHDNLFARIPQLGLPSLLADYLLYNVSL